VWGGLYCLPLFDSEHALRDSLTPHAQSQLVCEPAFVHVLTHKDLHLHACRVSLAEAPQLEGGRWVSDQEWPALGLPAPVRKLLVRD
jgi:A/G-specific adenine glycosylase